jgi:hypothetical protein
MSPDSQRRTRDSAKARVLALVTTYVFAAFPLLKVLTAGVGVYPLNGIVAGRDLLAVFGATCVLLSLLRFAGWTFTVRAAWLSVLLLLADAYALIPVPRMFEGRVGSGSVWFAMGYVISCAAVATAVIRPWRTKHVDPVPLTMIASVLLVMNVYPALRATFRPGPLWQPIAATLTTQTIPVREKTPPQRDIYVIVLDTFGRADVLREYYDLDISSFVASLEQRNFYVPRRSRSNYSQTFLALPALLNLTYLDRMAAAMGPESQDRRPLKYLIEQNRLMSLARQAGYTVVGIASDYTATETFPLADVCVCPIASPHELEYVALRLSPFAEMGRERWVSSGRRRRVLSAFNAIEEASRRPGRKFVVAHILSPHPPFVFDRDGAPRTPPKGMPFIHEELVARRIRARPEFAKEYVQGYAGQTAFVTARVLRTVEWLLEQPGPEPAIMIVGDHGPALELDVFDRSRTNLHERMSIFSAYRFPGTGGDALYPEMSPVNGARAIADRYLNVEVPLLPERSAFATADRPYEFITLSGDDF